MLRCTDPHEGGKFLWWRLLYVLAWVWKEERGRLGHVAFISHHITKLALPFCLPFHPLLFLRSPLVLYLLSFVLLAFSASRLFLSCLRPTCQFTFSPCAFLLIILPSQLLISPLTLPRHHQVPPPPTALSCCFSLIAWGALIARS